MEVVFVYHKFYSALYYSCIAFLFYAGARGFAHRSGFRNPWHVFIAGHDYRRRPGRHERERGRTSRGASLPYLHPAVDFHNRLDVEHQRHRSVEAHERGFRGALSRFGGNGGRPALGERNKLYCFILFLLQEYS